MQRGTQEPSPHPHKARASQATSRLRQNGLLVVVGSCKLHQLCLVFALLFLPHQNLNLKIYLSLKNKNLKALPSFLSHSFFSNWGGGGFKMPPSPITTITFLPYQASKLAKGGEVGVCVSLCVCVCV